MHRLHHRDEYVWLAPIGFQLSQANHSYGIYSSNCYITMSHLWIISCTVISLITCHGELINDSIKLAPRTGLEIPYAPVASSTVSSLIECAALCSRNPCCIAAIILETNESVKICNGYDIQLHHHLKEMENSTYLSYRFDKGEVFQFTFWESFNDYITLVFIHCQKHIPPPLSFPSCLRMSLTDFFGISHNLPNLSKAATSYRAYFIINQGLQWIQIICECSSPQISLNHIFKAKLPIHAQYEQLYVLQWEWFSTASVALLLASMNRPLVSHNHVSLLFSRELGRL